MLKTEYKFIMFEIDVRGAKNVWLCLNKKHRDMLGSVVYYERWKQFVFQPPSGTEFSADCLRDIADFLEQLNKENKNERT